MCRRRPTFSLSLFFFCPPNFSVPHPTHTHTPCLLHAPRSNAPCIRPVPRRARPRPCSHPLLSCKVSLARHARRSRLRRWAAIHPTAHAIRYSDPIPIRAFVMYRMWLQAQSTRDVALALIAWANETRARLFVTVAPCGRPSPEPDGGSEAFCTSEMSLDCTPPPPPRLAGAFTWARIASIPRAPCLGLFFSRQGKHAPWGGRARMTSSSL